MKLIKFQILSARYNIIFCQKWKKITFHAWKVTSKIAPSKQIAFIIRGDSLPLISHLPCLGARAPRPDSREILGNSPSTDHKYCASRSKLPETVKRSDTATHQSAEAIHQAIRWKNHTNKPVLVSKDFSVETGCYADGTVRCLDRTFVNFNESGNMTS